MSCCGSSARTSAGHTVGAMVVVNALGSALIGAGPHFYAAPLEQGAEFGGLGFPAVIERASQAPRWKGMASTPGVAPPSTTIACVATDARLDKAQAKLLAMSASAGLARGLRLSHALMDGDTVFAVSTGQRVLCAGMQDLIEIGALAADCVARAIARGVYEARVPGPAWSGPLSWHERFGR